MHRRIAAGAALFVSALAEGCAAHRLAYDPAALRAEVTRRAPDASADDLVVPFEIDAATADRARALVAAAETEEERFGILAAAFVDPRAFGMRYAPGMTANAAEALRRGEGNCVALASAFVGLARAVGLHAYFMDASTRVSETTIADDGTAVSEGHVAAIVETPSGNVGLDFTRLGPVRWYRVLDDVEALAHFYNNRGFEQIEADRERGADVDWAAAARQFRLAVQVAPGFARAWNNLGIASAHLGRRDEAIADWREAIRRDPRLVAPRNNLGAFLLELGEHRAALATLEGAARLSSSGPHVHYNLALARIRNGDRAGAVAALRRALRSGDYPRARALLRELETGVPAGHAGAPP